MQGESRTTTAGRNQALFREVNERIAAMNVAQHESGLSSERLWDFLCECPDPDCLTIIRLTPEEYEEIRTGATLFPVAPGHEWPDVEHVVRRHERFTVVEKVGEAAEIAVETDPRREAV